MSANPADSALDRIVGGQREINLLTSFFVFYKNSRILEPNNPTLIRQSDKFFELLSDILDEAGTVSLKVLSGRYFVDGKMVRIDDQGLSGAGTVSGEWEMIGVGGVSFTQGVSQEAVQAFVKTMALARPSKDNLEEVSERLKHQKLDGIKLLSAEVADVASTVQEVRRQFRVAARNTFFQAMNVVEEAVANTDANRDVNVSKTKRVVHSLIDHIMKDEASMVELTSIKNFDDYTYAHCTNVCVYSLTIGIRMGMDRPRLSQLGFSALFHDIGKVKLPADLVKKPDSFDENDWIQMQRHPLLGAKTILRNMKLDSHTARAARGAFEHHISSEFKGYPLLRYEKREINLFSKIIAISDTFDALTSGRVYLKDCKHADEAFRKMHFQMKSKFDPFLLKLFTNVVGVYPAGSLVLLTSEEIALVLTNNESDRNRPYVKIVGDRDGLLKEPAWADLSQPQFSDKSIVRLIDPESYGLNIEDFVLQD